jgi:hypothetical protein
VRVLVSHGRSASLARVELSIPLSYHYRRNQENIRSSLDEHRREFATAWEGMRNKILDSLSPEERQKFNALGSEHQDEGFLIVRAFAGAAAYKCEQDFAVGRASLADRLSITPCGASDVIRKLCEAKAITPTQAYVRHKKSARFRWVPSRPNLVHFKNGKDTITRTALLTDDAILPALSPHTQEANKDNTK